MVITAIYTSGPERVWIYYDSYTPGFFSIIKAAYVWVFLY